MSYLDRIVRYKKEELDSLVRRRRLADVKKHAVDTDPPRDFLAALRLTERSGTQIIAEIKKASPSRGVLLEDFDPIAIARAYEQHGASALSVLTDANFFQGSIHFIHAAKRAVALPALRKDFTLDEYHIYEARAAEADAILLIAGLLDSNQLSEYQDMAAELKMTSLFEVHDEKDLKKVFSDRTALPPRALLGINNRDLETFTTDLETTERLMKQIPLATIVVAESGIATRGDIERLQQVGVSRFLIGEALLTAPDIGKKLDQLLYVSH